MTDQRQPEPWLRGTLTEVPAVVRAVLHALELAGEDVERWCGDLSEEELHAQPANLPAVAFHLRHIAGALDRLLTYAEGNSLSAGQIAIMKAEADPGAARDVLFAEFRGALKASAVRIRSFSSESFSQTRKVGRQEMPTTVAGLLVHVADHTQRHVGQAITTAKVVKSERLR
ncbi:MAG: DinB family protein [Acidobacteria bacterium]|nr:DinB family protein [Acidobacteriota bacterium]